MKVATFPICFEELAVAKGDGGAVEGDFFGGIGRCVQVLLPATQEQQPHRCDLLLQ